jgi:hypothetical protein
LTLFCSKKDAYKKCPNVRPDPCSKIYLLLAGARQEIGA